MDEVRKAMRIDYFNDTELIRENPIASLNKQTPRRLAGCLFYKSCLVSIEIQIDAVDAIHVLVVDILAQARQDGSS